MVSPINFPGTFSSAPDSPVGNRSGADRSDTNVKQSGSDQTAARSRGATTQGATTDGATIRTAEDAMNVLRARVSQRLEQQLGSVSANGAERFSSPTFEAPSAEQVAQKVLGFVQQRLLAEAQSGADTDRLAGLLADAKAGVEQGFAEAREQIEVLGLMDDRLGADIDDSFSRILKGLDDLSDRFQP